MTAGKPIGLWFRFHKLYEEIIIGEWLFSNDTSFTSDNDLIEKLVKSPPEVNRFARKHEWDWIKIEITFNFNWNLPIGAWNMIFKNIMNESWRCQQGLEELVHVNKSSEVECCHDKN